MSFEIYRPELWVVNKDSIYAAIYALELGLEYSQALLIDRDSQLGRTHPCNRSAAVQMELHIGAMKKALKMLKAEPLERK